MKHSEMQRLGELAPKWRSLPQETRDSGLLAAGAVLLICAPALPGLSRLVVLPALLLAPGYALAALLEQAAARRSIAVVLPASLVVIICSSLLLDVSGIRLGSLSLGLTLGGFAALAAIICGSRRVFRRVGRHWKLPPDDRDLIWDDMTLNKDR